MKNCTSCDFWQSSTLRTKFSSTPFRCLSLILFSVWRTDRSNAKFAIFSSGKSDNAQRRWATEILYSDKFINYDQKIVCTSTFRFPPEVFVRRMKTIISSSGYSFTVFSTFFGYSKCPTVFCGFQSYTCILASQVHTKRGRERQDRRGGKEGRENLLKPRFVTDRNSALRLRPH